MRRLAEERPADAVLSEEGVDDPVRLDASRVWIIDPLDGTREYAEDGRPRLGRARRPLGRGHADRRRRRAAGRGRRTRNGCAAAPAAPGRPGRGGSRSAAAARRSWSRNWRGPLPAELVPMGSAGAKVAAVIRGDVDAYVHAGGQYEWDSAAPVAVALAAGLARITA